MISLFKQYDKNDCGPSVLRMIIKYYGRNISQHRLRDLCQINKEGVSIKSLEFAANKIGLTSVSIKASVDSKKTSEVPQLNEIPLPCVLFWNNNHFIVLYKIVNEKYYIADPAMGKRIIKKKEIQEHFILGNNYGKTILFEPNKFFYQEDNKYFKSNFFSSQLTFVLKHISQNKKIFWILSSLVVLKLLLQIVSPIIAQYTFDDVILGKDIHLLLIITAIQLFVFSVSSLFGYVESIISNKVSFHFSSSMIKDFTNKIFKMPLSKIQSRHAGDFIHRIVDISRIESFLTYNMTSFLLSFLTFFVLSGMLIYYDVKVFLIFLVFTSIFIFWTIYSIRKRRQLDTEKFDIQVDNHGYLTEVIEGLHEIKLNGNQAMKIEQIILNQEKFYLNKLKNSKMVQFLSIGSGFINNVNNGIIYLYVVYLTILGNISLGEMAAIQLIVIQLNSSVSSISSSAVVVQEVKFSLERILEIQSEKNEISGDLLPPDDFNIEFKDVNFAYSTYDTLVLENINISIQANKTTAIVGASGGGKTTILKLILGLYQPQKGAVEINGVCMSKYNLDEWRKKCGVVMQEGYIFTNSIINNICESGSSIDIQKYQQAVKIAQIQKFIQSLPLGEKTLIGKGGISLSTGQQQRILIARLVYKNPKFILLDEATNSLDSETEKKIMIQFESIFAGKTHVIIAHRLNTVVMADNIIVLKDGKVVEEGVHTELLNNRGYYFQLFEDQLNRDSKK